MSGAPDWKPERAPKRQRRNHDRLAVKQAALTDRECWACGVAGANGHHLVPKDWTKPGPDEEWNIISLCGSGTSQCHGAYHGSPYTVQVPSPFPFEEGRMATAHRDAQWVGRRIAERLLNDPRERERLAHLLTFFGNADLFVRFFLRQLHTPTEALRIPA